MWPLDSGDSQRGSLPMVEARRAEGATMCGRMMLTHSASEIAEAFGLDDVSLLQPRYNIAPSQPVAAIRTRPGERRRLWLLHWGLIPAWARDRAIGNRLINARSESAAEKPSFRSAMRRRRCIVPASGFYEWQRADAGGGRGRSRAPRIPHLFRCPDGGLLAIAGLHEAWTDRETGEVIESCTLLTTEANARVRPIHDRMPVLLEPADYALWLDPEVTDASRVSGLLVPAAPDRLEGVRVGAYVNDPRHEDARCIEPAV